ncbi:hypothetical protein D3C77_421350 [compost metagenome]
MTTFINNDEDAGIAYSYNDDFSVVRVIKRTKKVHTCAMCEEKIAVGSGCNYTVGKSVGQFFYYHSHMGCRVQL